MRKHRDVVAADGTPKILEARNSVRVVADEWRTDVGSVDDQDLLIGAQVRLSPEIGGV